MRIRLAALPLLVVLITLAFDNALNLFAPPSSNSLPVEPRDGPICVERCHG